MSMNRITRASPLGEHDFPARVDEGKAQFDTRTVDENAQFLVEKIKDAYGGNRVTKSRPPLKVWSATSF
ncbi:MAG: hypothetical protein Udaeo2_32620 [Candidatus Udaeobacter sp.]|nr:MAG: hypothetical protein Udaeo2_32620 [Candidatus Udaeobacter sp.]